MPATDTTTPSRSPLEPIFAGYPHIPFAFVEQFLHGDDLPYRVTLDGVMHRIWHRPAVLGPLFWALAKLGILVPYNAAGVPTTLTVRPGRDQRDGVYHVWDRTLAFPKPIRFKTTIIYDQALGKVVDLVGPRDVLYMVWEAKFHPPNRFTLDTHSCAIRVGPRKLWMPRWLWKFLLGTVTFTQTAKEPEGDTVSVDLLITHPLFGKIFGYVGTFRTVRTEAGFATRSGGEPVSR
jgi:hypothetical protein